MSSEYEDDLFLKEKSPNPKEAHNFNYLCALQSAKEFETVNISTGASDKYEDSDIEEQIFDLLKSAK